MATGGLTWWWSVAVPAGEKAAAQAASFGMPVAVAERSPAPRGTMVAGAVSTKTMREAALYLTGFTRHQVYGDRRLRRRWWSWWYRPISVRQRSERGRGRGCRHEHPRESAGAQLDYGTAVLGQRRSELCRHSAVNLGRQPGHRRNVGLYERGPVNSQHRLLWW
jgi:pyruvate/2-oxoglutarate dehydrogenase complex dihydrolipoamide dehydrogenase (E3) component